MRGLWALLVLILLLAAGCPRESLAGHRCNDVHPCVAGFRCEVGRCVVAGEGEPLPPELAGLVGYSVAYRMQIPTTGARFHTTGAPYAYNAAAAITAPVTRVGYFLELVEAGERSWVYVELDAPLADAERLGVPTAQRGVLLQQDAAHARVLSNHPGVTPGDDLAELNLEFWPGNYQASNVDAPLSPANADDARYDFGDGSASLNAGHGSMQIHNHVEGRTLFGFSDWGGNNPTNHLELGIGNQPTGEPDWTFSDSADRYTLKNLIVVVDALPERPAIDGSVPGVPDNVLAHVPADTAARYRLLYDFDIPDMALLGGAAPPPYDADHSAEVPPGSFDRVAWYVELQRGLDPLQFVWVSAAAFTVQADHLGVPTVGSGAFFQHVLADGEIVSNVATEGTGLSTLNVEFWPTNYAEGNALPVPAASATTFDFGDTPTAGTHGSMQVHNHESGETVFAYNNWGAGDGNPGMSDLGIGNQPTGNSDWTFAENADGYAIKRLQVLVRGRP